MKQRYSSGLLRAMRRVKRRRSGVAPSASEALEQRALLSSVTFNMATETAIFDADPGEANVVTVESPDSSTLIIRSQRFDANGTIVDDPITLQGDAAGNSGFSLDATQTELTISIDAAASLLSSLTVNVFDGDDTTNVESTPAAVSTEVNGGLGDDSFVLGENDGNGFVLDGIEGNVAIDGGSGSNDDISLLDFDSATIDIVDFTSSSVSGIAPGDISYDNAENLLVDTTDRVRTTFNVLSTAADVNTVVDLTFENANGDPVEAIVTVGNTDASFGTTPGNMDPIVGDISLVANSGLLTLRIDDSGDSTADTAVVGNGSVSGFSAGTVQFTPSASFEVLDVRAGTADDVITLTDSPVGVDLFAGDGDDSVLGSAFDDFIDGNLGDDTISAGAGDDLVLAFAGNDVVSGDDGNDELFGEGGDDNLSGGAGDDSLDGGDASDTISGGTGNDTIQGGFGDDVADGDVGNDLLLGADGADTLRGSTGRDTIIGGLGNDFLRGGQGRDTFEWNLVDGNDDVDGQGGSDDQIVFGTLNAEVFTVSASGSETVVTEAGGAILTIGAGVEEVRVAANAGNDEIIVEDLTGGPVQRVVALGEAGNDRLDAQNLVGGFVSLNGGSGNDVLFGGPESDTLRGGSGHDTMVGGTGADDIAGASGSDVILWSQGDGSDLIAGGNGRDRLEVTTDGFDDQIILRDASPTDPVPDEAILAIALDEMINGNQVFQFLLISGLDTIDLDTQAGQDTVTIDGLADTSLDTLVADLSEGPDNFDASDLESPVALRVLGGLGNDSLIGGPGQDFIRGSADQDTIRGGGGADQLMGDAGADSIAGGSGNDNLVGGGGDDYLGGREGSDDINGGAGDDEIDGGAGDDFIGGGSGQDTIRGGAGNDIVNAANGADVISGDQGDDVLIGGNGFDVITGNGGQDLLAAGRVNLTDGQLRVIGAEWFSDNGYSDRVDNIVGIGDENLDRANGDAFLLPITSERTIRDDEVSDTLVGNAGRDLFFADFDTDIVDGRVPNEEQIDLR